MESLRGIRDQLHVPIEGGNCLSEGFLHAAEVLQWHGESRTELLGALQGEWTQVDECVDEGDLPETLHDMVDEYAQKEHEQKQTEKKKREARSNEMEKLRQMEVYSYAPWSRIPPDTRVLGTTWVDESKGSRLCVQEFATTRRTDLFSATPPLCLTRVLISRCATATRGGGGGRQLMALDVRRAFLHGVVERELFVRPPPEDTYASSHGLVWKLEKSLCGTRDAPQLWRKQVVATMLEAGFQMCKVSPCLFFHDQRDLMVIVHVDDFLACGSKADLVWVRTAVERKYEIKSEILLAFGWA